VALSLTATGTNGESPPRLEQSAAQTWKDAEVALAKLKRLIEAFEEALTLLERNTVWTAEVSKGWSSCLALIARLLHKEGDEVRLLMLSILDERSKKIVGILLSTMDQLPARNRDITL
jgi:hypothetical protein